LQPEFLQTALKNQACACTTAEIQSGRCLCKREPGNFFQASQDEDWEDETETEDSADTEDDEGNGVIEDDAPVYYPPATEDSAETEDDSPIYYPPATEESGDTEDDEGDETEITGYETEDEPTRDTGRDGGYFPSQYEETESSEGSEEDEATESTVTIGGDGSWDEPTEKPHLPDVTAPSSIPFVPRDDEYIPGQDDPICRAVSPFVE